MTPAGWRIGLLGGTFDPVHNGHLAMAAAAERACNLDRIYFVPAPQPGHRAAPVASYADRYAMLALALAAHPCWQPLAIPDRPRRPTYAVDQIAWMQRHLGKNQICYVLGADAFVTLPTWRDYRRLLGLCEFAVLARAGSNREDAMAIGTGGRVHWLGHFAHSATATSIRGGQRRPPLPRAVQDYIKKMGLYPRA